MFDMTEPHIPVLIAPILSHAAPIEGVWVDGTFGAGGYSRALLEAGASKLIGIDKTQASSKWRKHGVRNMVIVWSYWVVSLGI